MTFKGFEKENGEVVEHAFLDGRLFGDRILEGVIFHVSICPKGQLHVRITEKHRSYFHQFNTKELLEDALAFAIQNDIFQETEEGGEDIYLLLAST